MPTSIKSSRRARLSIDVEPELRRRIKIAAAEKDLSVREFLEVVLRRALEAEEREAARVEGPSWTGLSARSFTRDWESEEDQAYDRLAEG